MNNPILSGRQQCRLAPAGRALATTLLFALSALLLSSATALAGQKIKTNSGGGADSYVRSGTYASTNYGSEITVYTKNGNGDFGRKIYLRFDVSGMVGDRVKTATLRLHNSAPSADTISIYGLNDGVTGDSSTGWTESGITWNNAPANDTTTGNGVTSSATLLGTFAETDSTGFSEFSSDALADFLNDDGNNYVTLILTSGTNVVNQYDSKENAPVGGAAGDLAPELELVTEDEILTNEGGGADAYVRSGAYASTNFGGTTTVVTKNGSTDFGRKAYVRFDVSGVTWTAPSVRLSLINSAANADTISVYALNDATTGDGTSGWTESGITWDNAPANNTSSGNGVTSAATLLGTFSQSGTTGEVIFSAQALTDLINNDSNDRVSLIITSGTNVTNQYYSKEYVPTGGSAGDLAPMLLVEMTQTHTITASAGANGSISPSGSVAVANGGTQLFTISANTGYVIADVVVDGQSVGAVSSYEFTNVTSNHSIEASFEIETFTISATAGSNGTIDPAGDIVVNHGSNQSFTIAADTGYQVDDVLVDGVSVGAVTSYTFTSVTADHSIATSFVSTGGGTDVTKLTSTTGGADATIRGGVNAGTNYGSDTTVAVKAAANMDFARKMYLRFPVDCLSSTSSYQSATLKLQRSGTNYDETLNFYGLNDGLSGDASTGWTESGITWNNAPANDTSTNNGVTSNASFLGTLSLTAAQTGQVSFSSEILVNFLNADTNGYVTIIVTSSVSDTNSFDSKETSGGSEAALELNYSGTTDTCAGSGGGGGNPYGGTDYNATPSNYTSVLSSLNPGDRMFLADGNYNRLVISSKSGTATKPITILATNERKPFFQGTGSTPTLDVTNSSYIIVEGLRIENVDNSNSTTQGGLIGQVSSSDHITLKRNLFRKTNRWANNAGVQIGGGSTYCLLEENELIDFHRNGIVAKNDEARYNVFRRNYANPQVYPYQGSKSGPNDAIIAYAGNSNTFENNIAENTSSNSVNQGIAFGSWGKNNKFYGNIAVRAKHGGASFTGNTKGHGDNNTWLNNLAFDSRSNGFFANTVTGYLAENNTAYSASSQGFTAFHSRAAYRPAGFESGITWRNNLALNGANYGYTITDTADFAYRTIEYSSGYSNASGTWGSGTSTRTNTIADQNPGQSTRIYIPSTSPYSGAGKNGADVGANILYRYENGVLTSVRLWDPTTGEFTGRGALVSGVNDVAGENLFDVHQRLNISSSTLPSGY